jgi:hypothetical protein
MQRPTAVNLKGSRPVSDVGHIAPTLAAAPLAMRRSVTENATTDEGTSERAVRCVLWGLG